MMTLLDAPLPLAPHRLAVTLRPRVDLAAGSVCALGVETAAGDLPERMLALRIARRMAPYGAGRGAPLSIAAPEAALQAPETLAALDAAFRAEGFGPRALVLEVEESRLAAAGREALDALERLRARGWGVALRMAPECPLPLGGRARASFTELLAPFGDHVDAFFALAGFDDSSMALRVRAAAAAGLSVTAMDAPESAWRRLADVGFDRAAPPPGGRGGPPTRALQPA